MKVKAKITASSLTEGIKFYGDASRDDESLKRLKELAMLLEDVVSDLRNVERQVKDRSEGSAKEIKEQLEVMQRDLLWIAYGEEKAEKIIELIKEGEE